jgi:hypothetical protein
MHSRNTTSINGVKATGGLVEEQKLCPGGQCSDQLNLLPVGLRKRANTLVDVELEPVNQLISIAAIRGPVQCGEQFKGLGWRERRAQAGLARNVGDSAVGLYRLLERVEAKELGVTRGWSVQAEQQTNRGRLTSAVWSQEPVHLTWIDGQIKPVARDS